MLLREWLSEIDACSEAVEWVGKRRSLPRAWQACKRADWMRWLLLGDWVGGGVDMCVAVALLSLKEIHELFPDWPL